MDGRKGAWVMTPSGRICERGADKHRCEERRYDESQKWHNVFLTARAGFDDSSPV
jgi:hypothetical protein